jgi:hypothetical protein
MDDVERRVRHGCGLTTGARGKFCGVIGNIASGLVGVECCLTRLGFGGIALHPSGQGFECQAWAAIIWFESFEDWQNYPSFGQRVLGRNQVIGVGE